MDGIWYSVGDTQSDTVNKQVGLLFKYNTNLDNTQAIVSDYPFPYTLSTAISPYTFINQNFTQSTYGFNFSIPTCTPALGTNIIMQP